MGNLSGEYTFHLLIDDVPIKGFPLTLELKPSIDSSLSYASGPGLIGKKGQITVFPMSKNSKPVLDECSCIIDMIGPEGKIAVKNSQNNNGKILAEYKSPLPVGDYKIDISLDNQKIKNSPFNFRIEPLDASMTCLKGPGLTGASGQFTIYPMTKMEIPFMVRVVFHARSEEPMKMSHCGY